MRHQGRNSQPENETPWGKVAESSAHAARATELPAEQIPFHPRTAPSIAAKHLPPAAREGVGVVRTHLEKREICCGTALLDNVRTLGTQNLGTSTVLHCGCDTGRVRKGRGSCLRISVREGRDSNFSVRNGLTNWSQLILKTDEMGPEPRIGFYGQK